MKKMSAQKRTAVIVTVVAVVLVAAALICWAVFRPGTQAGAKTFTINVAHSDGTTASYELSTDEEYLYDAQLEEGILQGDTTEYGVFVTVVDGETADSDAGEYWMYDINGEMAQYGVESQPIADGDVVDFYIYVWE